MDELHNRRRNYFIKKQFQAKFIVKFCALVVLGALISGFVIYAMSKSTVTTTFENSRLMIKSTADYILPAVLLGSVVVIISIGLATIAVTLFTSHKIAGPLYRMEKDVAEVAGGNLTKRFNLRRGDEVRPLAEALDAMAQSLRSRMLAVRRCLEELDAELAKSCKDAPPEVREKAAALKRELDKFIA